MSCCFTCSAERIPIFVDLDVGQGDISIPGSLGKYQSGLIAV